MIIGNVFLVRKIKKKIKINNQKGDEMFINTKEYTDLLCKYPHIAKHINLYWGGPEMNTYFSDLILGNRNGVRKGFTQDDIRCIRGLMKIHMDEYPKFLNLSDEKVVDRRLRA